jgi:catechol 2,3-dioxygenase-like lactoylglutathione lyase family enzyme
MPIQNVIINSADIGKSVHFYTKFLEARVIGEATSTRALLDMVTGTIELRAVGASPAESTWIADDLQKGFRHVGFKVDAVDPRAEVLKAADVPFHLDPLNAEGGVRICFFFDPDGTLLEFVEGDLQYASILDADGVAKERALGVPSRPRLDHVAVTVEDRAATEAFYRDFGFSFIGTIEQPHDSRGFSIGYLKSGDTVLEVFTYQTGKQDRAPQVDAPGFAYAELAGERTDHLSRAATVAGAEVYVDADGLLFSVAPAGPGRNE